MRAYDYPTMAEYCTWARERGFEVFEREFMAADQRLIVVTIVGNEQRRVVEVVEELADRLASTTVARLDRGLASKSWLFA